MGFNKLAKSGMFGLTGLATAKSPKPTMVTAQGQSFQAPKPDAPQSLIGSGAGASLPS